MFPDAQVIISAADILDVRKRVENVGWENWQPATKFLSDFNPYDYEWGKVNPDFVKYTIDTCLLCQSNVMDPNKIFMRSIDIVVTERCSMKCKECSNLMQYYKQPKTYSWEEMESSIDKFLEIVDEVNESRVIGGEPFVNKQCHRVVKKLNDSPKIRQTMIYTNGTICPTDEQMELLKSINTSTALFTAAAVCTVVYLKKKKSTKGARPEMTRSY
jgi:hypothetical protein